LVLEFWDKRLKAKLKITLVIHKTLPPPPPPTPPSPPPAAAAAAPAAENGPVCSEDSDDAVEEEKDEGTATRGACTVTDTSMTGRSDNAFCKRSCAAAAVLLAPAATACFSNAFRQGLKLVHFSDQAEPFCR